jgi:outer membrane protein TolC
MKALVLIGLVFLGGCATLQPDAGFSEVEQTVAERTGAQTQWTRTAESRAAVQARVRELLAEPLGAREAVQVALLNHPGLQARFADVGIAEADLVQASRWRGPRLSFARLRRGDELEIERSVFFDLLGLVTIPLSVRGEEARFAAAKNRAAAGALVVALEARKAWFDAVAAAESARYMLQVRDAAEASAALAQRLRAAGNWSELAAAREQAFHAEAAAQLARARQIEASARERLARALGLWGEQLAFRLPERLPDMPATPRPLESDLEGQALAQRLDVRAARREAESLASSLGLTRITGFVSLLEFGLHSNGETGRPEQHGWEFELTLPLFDWGTARTARAERLYLQAVQHAADTAIRARSEVRETYRHYRAQLELAQHYRNEVVPLRKRISDEVLLRYNGMLASAFELLADAREQVSAVSAAIEAQRAFWIAEAEFQMALTGASPGPAVASASAAPSPRAPAALH